MTGHIFNSFVCRLTTPRETICKIESVKSKMKNYSAGYNRLG